MCIRDRANVTLSNMDRQFKYLINRRVVWRQEPTTDIPDEETKEYMFFKNGTYQYYDLFRSKAKITTYRSFKWHMLVLWYLNPEWTEDDALDIAIYLSYKPNGFTSQILISAKNNETNEIEEYSVSRLNTNKDTVNARLISNPQGGIVKIPTEDIIVNKKLRPSWINYSDPLTNNVRGMSFDAIKCLNNSVFVTIIATIITVLINSMAAFALSKYKFNGQIIFFIIILATLMVPASVLIVGIFKMVSVTGLNGTLWGVIIPGAATPTGVFMLRQYMLTIPDELLEAARMDAASEWSIYWRIVFPLALPAIAVLAILSIIWRWNDLILPMIAVSTTKTAYTIQLCLLDFQGEYVAQEHYRLAMTVVSLIPTTLVFVFLQRYITTGIANTGIK